MINDTAVSLPMVPRELLANYGTAPAYSAVYRAVLDGRLPAKQERGRWYVARADLPKVAELFALAAA